MPVLPWETYILEKSKNLFPGLNAAFVDVGFEKDAFLHYTDLSPYARSLLKFTQQAINDNNEKGFDFGNFQVEPEIIKTGKINEVLKWQTKYSCSDLKGTNCCQRSSPKL